MVNFLTLLALMTDKHYTKFFLSLQSYIDNAFGVFHSPILHSHMMPVPFPPT